MNNGHLGEGGRNDRASAEQQNESSPSPVIYGYISEPSRTSGFAIASVVLGSMGLFTYGLTAVIGLILGIIAYAQIGIYQGHLKGARLAATGISISGVVILLILLGIFWPFPYHLHGYK